MSTNKYKIIDNRSKWLVLEFPSTHLRVLMFIYKVKNYRQFPISYQHLDCMDHVLYLISS